MNCIYIAPVLKKALTGVVITSATTTIIAMNAMKKTKKETKRQVNVKGVVYNGFYNTIFFEKGGKKLLVKALEQEGFYNIEIIHYDEDCIKIRCNANTDVSSVFMVKE